MIYSPSLEKARNIADNYKVIPLSCEIFSDIKTPIEVLKILKTVSRNCYMLESLENPQNWGRYTFLGFDPKLELTCINGKLKIVLEEKIIEESTTCPKKYIRQIVNENKSPRFENLPPFTGGLVGYFAYDYIKYIEPNLELDGENQEGFKDVDLMLFDKVIAFDHLKKKIIIIANVKTKYLETSYKEGVKELDRIVKLIKNSHSQKNTDGKLTSEFRPQFSKEEYCNMVNKAKNYIYEGDIFQVVLSNRLEADFEGSLLNTYRILRTTNPSPYMYYFSSDDIEIAGASPETLVKIQDNTVYTFPLAGTRQRGKTYIEDLELEKELLSDEKELAEHNMLVDLGRNDLGKVSEFGSVEVEKYLSIERFSHVMHIGSTIKGLMKNSKDGLDAIDAVLPAGTLSGAPKIRACEIINELENKKRGIYGGAIGYIDFTGNIDTCIAIRIAYKKNGKVFIHSGAGIVADSVPEKEYQECFNKAKAIKDALEFSEEVDY
ncbi:anthranilate synthase component I [Anaerovorax odorimutans]|uniref:anthranilate synthase component I n=1 Tax=Anaerovorax odorimutans TaxID=109327 RepID=UPI00041E23F4|nr:anthranilate synthase component I [Anaerovorax odorimutans]